MKLRGDEGIWPLTPKGRGVLEKREKFYAYHHDNPRVYEAFVDGLRELQDAGRRKISLNFLKERIRWFEYGVIDKPGEDFGFSNDHWPYYSERIRWKERDWILPDLLDWQHKADSDWSMFCYGAKLPGRGYKSCPRIKVKMVDDTLVVR